MTDEKSEILAPLSPLEPRDGTTTFEPVGLTRWETGSCKLRNTGICLAASVELIVIVQLCFATELRSFARTTLEKRKDT